MRHEPQPDLRGCRLRASSLALIALMATASCKREPPPNVLIVTVDSLRADRLGAYGNQHGVTPFLDSLAQRGTVFANAFSVSSSTSPAVASLMTSRDPRQHLVTSFGSPLARTEQTFAEVLQARGYRTGGFSASFRLSQRLGYAQGFQQWQAEGATDAGLPASTVRAQGLGWLSQVAMSQPTLLYFHFMEPHMPYVPAEPFRSRFLRSAITDAEIHLAFQRAILQPTQDTMREASQIAAQLYDGEVAACDDQLRLLFDALTQGGFLDHAIVILTSDHGEELFEHGANGHDHTLFTESMRIPLIVIAPGYVGGRRIEENVSLLDVAPTLIDLLGFPAEPHFEGESLVPLLEPESGVRREWSKVVNRRQSGAPRDLLFRLDFNGMKPDQRVHSDGLLRWTQKLVIRPNGQHDVYDLAADPAEQSPNPPGSEGIASLLEQAFAGQTTILKRRAMAR